MLDLHAIKTMVCISYQNRYETRVTLSIQFFYGMILILLCMSYILHIVYLIYLT